MRADTVKTNFITQKKKTFNQMTPINRDEVEQDRHLNNIQYFIWSLRPDNSKKKTTYDLNIWRTYCSAVGETRALEKIPSEEFNILLCRFFMDVRKKDGGVYEPGLLGSLQRSTGPTISYGQRLNLRADVISLFLR